MTPACVVKAYEHQARKLGVRFVTSTIVEEIICREGRVTGVRTHQGSANCRYVIYLGDGRSADQRMTEYRVADEPTVHRDSPHVRKARQY